ncbi:MULTISPECIES: tetratricopeptide repeat protein [Nostoc]|uniref:Tetratricopeptide repeat protein n=1 Tax=Nostoc paludosum FACHB-159 TaxID=2692908 RepID=A0ABR8K2Q9_9NOSO|nr:MULTISPECIES: tetratricopeptide repeat protein [Nostoc]MBD2677157.1 tetratricopeptide repeat protein [Nostoc sp. FACHB-857]MBD2733034.1 tetratricopeptide repeat protein [Nostoc paludosum FACHB-159]
MKIITNYLSIIFGVCSAFFIFSIILDVAKAQEQPACPSGQITDSNGSCSPSSQGQNSTSMASAQGFFRSGRKLAKQGQSQDAIAEYTRAIELDPNYAEAYFYRGNTLALEGQPQKGIEDLQKAAAIFTSRGESERAQAVQQHEEIIRRGIQEGEF